MDGNNSGTAPGETQGQQPPGKLICGDVGTYGELSKKENTSVDRPGKKPKAEFNNDHVPAKAQLLKRADKLGAFLPGNEEADKVYNACVKRGVTNGGMAICIPTTVHYKGRTYGGKNRKPQIDADSQNEKSLKKAVKDDMDAISPHLEEPCKGKYEAARQKMMDFDVDKMIADVVKKCASA